MNLKKLVEILPLIVGFLIFNGFLKLYLFYGNWNIKIIEYLDFSEIILSFLNDLSVIILCTIIGVIYTVAVGRYTETKVSGMTVANL